MSTSTIVSERECAKQIIGEIIRQAGGLLSSKSELVRIFWRAHLLSSEAQPGYLSFWPLLKTATGPAIQDADLLLAELVADGTLRIDETSTAGVSALRLAVTDHAQAGEPVAPDVARAIGQAIASADEPPDLADYTSLRCWNEASVGEELNIYLDIIPEAEYVERKQRLEEMAGVLQGAWE